MSATLKAKSSKTVILFFFFFVKFSSVAIFKSHSILMDFQKHVNQDLLLTGKSQRYLQRICNCSVKAAYMEVLLCACLLLGTGTLESSYYVSGLMLGTGRLEVVSGHPRAPQLMEKWDI